MRNVYTLHTSYSIVALVSSISLSLARSSLFAQPSLSPLTTSRLAERHDHYIGAISESSEGPEIPSTATNIQTNSTNSFLNSTSLSSASPLVPSDSLESLSTVDKHNHHNSRLPPKLELDESEILKSHSPDPPSYYDLDQTDEGMKGTMMGHIVTMAVAFFIFLPLAIFLKAGGSSLSILPQIAFLLFALIGFLLGQIYSWNTPSRYKQSSHKSFGYVTMLLAIGINLVDVGRFVIRSTRFVRFKEKLASHLRFGQASHQYQSPASSYKYDEDQRQVLLESPDQERFPRGSVHELSSSYQESATSSSSDAIYTSAEANDQSERPRSGSTRAQVCKIAKLALDLSMSILVLLAYIQVFNGVAIYFSFCRENYLNGCLAHGIKGSIFFWYGLLTFARYCGGMSKLGWAWNRKPGGRTIFTAEFVESFVIFLYGATQTWMERWGKSGSYSVKDVQHISIAIMESRFWAAGALGMLLENRYVRDWLAIPAVQASNEEFDRITQPASSSFSFNPFPALVIGVTGIAMSAHHQTYQFQVEIHALWGHLLAAFSLFRFLTYFFLYLRPPASILPSRPSTEALASLFLTCGGVVFVLSTEQITFAAMRHQADDVMAFLNVTVASVCTVFFFVALLFALKGWALKRSLNRHLSQSSTLKSA
ncbi:hypothetical protein JCM5353_005187 [Sporobolomyces roseus]